MGGRRNKLTGQIGEFLVSAKLGKLGLIATPFSGNVPRFDLIVADEQCRCLPIQVKCSNSNNWPASASQWMDIEIDDGNKRQVFKGVLSLSDPDLIYVCVAIGQPPEGRDRFFILRKVELQEVCVAHYCSFMDKIHWRRPRNYKSLDNRYCMKQIQQYEDNWNLISDELGKRRSMLNA